MPETLQIVRVLGPATVQDGGRPGRQHEGVPPGGALDPSALARANRAAGNRWDAAAIEHTGPITVRAGGGGIEVSVDGACVRLAIGDELEVPAPAALAGYLAVRGGLDVPVVLGGRGTLLVAGFGGHEGRLLRGGDAIAVGRDVIARARVAPGDAGAVRVLPGPDLDRAGAAALDALLAGEFRASVGDRVGTRLLGPNLRREGGDAGISLPMVRGAIQLPGSGEPVVLGPDHPTTGGYPVIAVIIRADHGRVESLRPGAVVRFRQVTLEDAVRAAAEQRARRA